MTRRVFVACLLAAIACSEPTDDAPIDAVQLRVEGREWTADPDPAFADMVAAFVIADSLVAPVPTNGTFTVGSSMTGVLNPWVIEQSQGRDLLTTSGDNTRVDFMGGPCSPYEDLCFRGVWRYHQPDGEVIVLGSVASAGVFTPHRAVR